MVKQVEVCKSENGLPAEIHAILDGISQKALTYKFLVTNESKMDVATASVWLVLLISKEINWAKFKARFCFYKSDSVKRRLSLKLTSPFMNW